MHKWVRITCFVLSLIVLALITLMVINTEVSLKYEIDGLDTTDRIYIGTADKYFKFKIEAITEFAIYVLINITIIVAFFEKKRKNRLMDITWAGLSLIVLLQILLMATTTTLGHDDEVSNLICLGFDSVPLNIASGYLKGTILTLKEFALYVLINIIFIVIKLLNSNGK